MFIITKVNTTRKLFTTFVHEIVRIYVCYFFISSELLDKIYFFTIISINRIDKT
ncbi:metallo-beta-lactamase, partial [Bacillus thuringiensis]